MAAHAFRIGTVERETGEELGSHAATLAGVVAATTAARPRRLRFAQLEEEVAALPHLREATRVTDRTGLELVVDDERARVHVADRIDQAQDSAGAAHVQAGKGIAEGVQVEERVTGQHIFAMR